jgi:amino acid permease
MYAMSRSGLLPSALSLTSSTGTPWVAMVSGSLLGYVVCVAGRITYKEPEAFARFNTIVYNCMLIVALSNYITQICSFIILRVSYRMLSRGYSSPFGISGAVVGFTIFGTSLIALLGWGSSIWLSVVLVLSYMSIGIGYYILVARKKLLLSPEEQVALFMIYSIKFIRGKQTRVINAKKYKLDEPTIAPSTTMHKRTSKSRVPVGGAKSASTTCQPSSATITADSHAQPMRGSLGGRITRAPSVQQTEMGHYTVRVMDHHSSTSA